MGTKRASDEWSSAIAAQIRAERAALGVTQVELLTRANLPKSTYIRIETGERAPDVTQVAKIAGALGMSVSTLIQRAEERVAPSLAS